MQMSATIKKSTPAKSPKPEYQAFPVTMKDLHFQKGSYGSLAS
jgi:hypothetical protein